MQKILVTGGVGQIGSELVMELRRVYGAGNVICGVNRTQPDGELKESGPWEIVDCTNAQQTAEVVKKYKIDSIYHLAAILSAVAEAKPNLAWNVNINALYNVLEVAREEGCAVFTPSSIGAFGSSTPLDNTPQDTIQRPSTMYGVTKVAGELLCDYYYKRFGVDTRGVRFPGIISNVTLPGGGTTDYAVEIYYEAIRKKRYTCNLPAGTFLDMMYMPDALKAAIDLMEADPARLIHRNAFNVTAMSFDPEIIAAEIRKHIPEFVMDYKVDKVKEGIANSWPNSMDDSAARAEWDWEPFYDLAAMTEDMLTVLGKKLK
ncbi:MAG: L-threonine 3-dehydrogenase [Candidatus Cloacimonetes bacterium]|nr:L-threonine 3-dehydrogenase [Candidatus Cloacimonadota bacterium]